MRLISAGAPTSIFNGAREMCSERLCHYRELIHCMPVKDQATISSTDYDIWRTHKEDLAPILRQFPARDGGHFVEISRQDLFDFAERGISKEFVYAVFIWGYPTGGRGDNFRRVIDHSGKVTEAFRKAPRALRRDDLNQLCARLRGCGIGPSTLTKLLYFLDFTVDGYRALILDGKVMRTFQRRLFEEDFGPSAKTIYEEAGRRDPDYLRIYPDYLREMSRASQDLGGDPDELEMFLFLFVNSLKSHC